MATTQAQTEFFRESFPKFTKLPAELRIQIWNEVLPHHGIYPMQLSVESDTHSEGHSVYTLRLEPSNAEAGYDTRFPGRIRAMRSLLLACQESRAMVKGRFPDALKCHGHGEMQFNADKDLIYVAGSQEEFSELLLCVDFGPERVSFAESWNLVVRRLAVESELISLALEGMQTFIYHPEYHRNAGRITNNFVTIVRRMVSLKQLVLATHTYLTSEYWDGRDPVTHIWLEEMMEFQDMMDHVYSSGMERGTEQQAEPRLLLPIRSLAGHIYLKSIIHPDPGTKEIGTIYLDQDEHTLQYRYMHVYQDGHPCRFYLCFGLKVGYPELSHLDIVAMVHPDPEMKARGIFREMEFE